ncbi:MAG: hypothetical protein NC210_05520 [[Clostridium] fimetarium]|nr:hypothetical protein [Alistipes timonensis]MCM1405867.1 hypothetical protein [[Clostridium] fimetarium]
MFINKVILLKYGLDKLYIKYRKSIILEDVLNDNCQTNDGFLFNPISNHLSYKVYEVFYRDLLIGKISFKEKDNIILEVENRLLYSDCLDNVYLFAERFELQFVTFSKLDIYCDCNVDLPSKLNRLLRSKVYTITRKGVEMLNANGNLDLGVKILQNKVILKGIKEKTFPTYNFTPIKTSGCLKCPVRLVGYNKTVEVLENSHKYYVLESLPFGSDVVHRLEIRTCGYEMRRFGVDVDTLYYHLSDSDTIKSLFRDYINRFFEFRKDGKCHSVSELLRLDKEGVQGG